MSDVLVDNSRDTVHLRTYKTRPSVDLIGRSSNALKGRNVGDIATLGIRIRRQVWQCPARTDSTADRRGRIEIPGGGRDDSIDVGVAGGCQVFDRVEEV